MEKSIIKSDHSSIINPEIISKLVLQGDISQMDQVQRVEYYSRFCNSLGLNPLTQPFQIIRFQGKERLYATKDCTEQLRKIYGVSVVDLKADKLEDNYIVRVTVKDREGRMDIASGAVVMGNLKGEALANCIMKAETKAKRRATLSICGLGMMDESEIETLPTPVETLPITNQFDAKKNFSPSDRPHVPKTTGAEAMTKDVERHHQEAINSGDPTRPATTRQKAEILLLLNNEYITASEKEKMVNGIHKLDVERADKAITKLKETIEQRDNKHHQVTKPATVKQIERLNHLMNDDVVTERERAEYVKASAVLTSEQAFSLIEFWEKTIPARRAVEAEERSPV